MRNYFARPTGDLARRRGLRFRLYLAYYRFKYR